MLIGRKVKCSPEDDPNWQPSCIANLANCNYTDLLRINVNLLQKAPEPPTYTMNETFERWNRSSNGRFGKIWEAYLLDQAQNNSDSNSTNIISDYVFPQTNLTSQNSSDYIIP